MRSHSEIIEDGGGWRSVRDKLGMPKAETRAKFWHFRDNIPGQYWSDIVRAELASLDELAAAAARQRYLKERNYKPPNIGRPRKVNAA